MDYFFIGIAVLGFLMCVTLGLFMLLRNPRHPSNIGFALGLVNLSVISAAGAILPLSRMAGMAVLSSGVRVFISGMAALPASWLLFSIAFSRVNSRELILRWAPLLAILPVLSAFFVWKSGSADFVPSASVFAGPVQHISLGPSAKYLFIYMVLGLLINIMHFEATLRSSSGAARWRIKYLIFGVGSVLIYFLYLSSQALLFSSLNIESVHIASAVILIAVAMMAVFIAKYRLLDADIFVSRYVIYNSFTLLAVGLYLLIVGAVAQGIRHFDFPLNRFLETLFVFISVLLLVVFSFAAAFRRKIQLFITRHFYRHKYEFRDKWMETTEKISPGKSVSDICSTLVDLVSENMCAKPVYIWLYDPSVRAFTARQDGVAGPLRMIPPDHPFIRHLGGIVNPFFFSEPSMSEGARAFFNGSGFVLCAPLAAGPETIGFVMLGPDISGAPYVQDDLELLRAVSAQAAVQIKNIRLAEELMASKEMEAFSKMSSFIMHDLKNLTNSLSLISQNAQDNMDNPEFQRDTIRTIDGTVSRMKKVIERLSNIPKEQQLKMQLTDIGELVEKSLMKLAFPVEKEIVLKRSVGVCPPVLIDPEAFEMVILNLLLNAYDAISGSGEISVSAFPENGRVNILVADTGRGMTEEYIQTSLFKPFKSTKKNGLGIGLYQCKSIIEAHGGCIEVKSSAEKGTSFSITLPAHLNGTVGVETVHAED